MKKAIIIIMTAIAFINCTNKPKEDKAKYYWDDMMYSISRVDTLFAEDYDSIMAYGTEYAKDSIRHKIAAVKAAIAEDAANNVKRLCEQGEIDGKELGRFVDNWLHYQSLVP